MNFNLFIQQTSHEKVTSGELFRCCIAGLFLLFVHVANGQAVSEVVTDFGGYWRSSATSINPIKPNNSHNLVSFVYNGTRYSTGVNDSLLSSKGLSYIGGDFRALPVQAINSVVNGNTKIGLGSLYDGNSTGPSSAAPENNFKKYLTDGIKGLDIGTGVANLPSGSLVFEVTDLKISSIQDGIPDILVTQFADPSGSTDVYEFLDSAGQRVGNVMNIAFNNIPSLGNWTADFYEASSHPMNLTPGFTRTDRPLRVWAADFESFGITSSNISRIRSFKINLSGNSDVAFVGYNYNTLMVILPVQLQSFSGRTSLGKAELNWTTTGEKDLSEYIIEKSSDARKFQPIGSIQASNVGGNGTNVYSFIDNNPGTGAGYYRLKILHIDGSFSYSEIIYIRVQTQANKIVLRAYPNPARHKILVQIPESSGTIEIIGINGKSLFSKDVVNVSLVEIDLNLVAPGIYTVLFRGLKTVASSRLIVAR